MITQPMAYYNNRPGHHTWNVSSVTYWNPIDMFFSEQVYIIKWWSKNQVSENSVKYSWKYEALSVPLKCPINHEIKKIKISCFGNTEILTLTCFDPNLKKFKTREQGWKLENIFSKRTYASKSAPSYSLVYIKILSWI